jgi:hypothetical protein
LNAYQQQVVNTVTQTIDEQQQRSKKAIDDTLTAIKTFL